MRRASTSASLDVASIVDQLPIGAFHLILLACCTLLALTDGYDIAVIGVAGQLLVKEWHITNLAELGPVFSAGLLGGVIGPPLFGALSDRYGRKTVLLWSAVIYGLLNLVTMAAGSLPTIAWMRLLSGIVLGGVLPTATALAVEYAPTRWKLTFGMIVITGLALGAGLPGPFAVLLGADYGWRSLLFVGAIVPIALAILVVPLIPESLKFLSLDRRRRDHIVSILKRLCPGLKIDSQSQLFDSRESDSPSFSKLGHDLKDLFAGSLAFVTPLLWALIMACFMSTYFFQTWMPTLTASIGLPRSEAALSFTWFAIGGCIATAILSRPVTRYGMVPLTFLFAISVPLIASLGAIVSSRDLFPPTMMAVGFCLNGLLFCLLGFAGVIYPTRVRSSGIGWSLGLGRLGGAVGPYIGGILVGFGLEMKQLAYAAAMPLALGVILSLILTWIYYARGLGAHEITLEANEIVE